MSVRHLARLVRLMSQNHHRAVAQYRYRRQEADDRYRRHGNERQTGAGGRERVKSDIEHTRADPTGAGMGQHQRHQAAQRSDQQAFQSEYPQHKAAMGAENPEIHRFANAGLSGGEHIPVLILQGTADTVVTPPSQRAFVTELCSLRNSVTFLEYPAVAHYQTRSVSFLDTLAWMENIVAGGVPESHCNGLEAEE